MAVSPRRRSGRRSSVRSFVWSVVEARVRHDRLLVDQVALEARQHLLVRHVERPEHGEAAEPDAARREHGGERLEVARLRLEAGANLRRQRGQGAGRLDVDEAPVEGELEVPIEARVRSSTVRMIG